MHLGILLGGAAGSGKTEVTKGMAAALGVYCVVYHGKAAAAADLSAQFMEGVALQAVSKSFAQSPVTPFLPLLQGLLAFVGWDTHARSRHPGSLGKSISAYDLYVAIFFCEEPGPFSSAVSRKPSARAATASICKERDKSLFWILFLWK